MASPNAPKSSEQLIREHSKARIHTPNPSFRRSFDYYESRQLTDSDAVDQQARKYR